jgi:lipopolysaccharide/colanic/teichoic acid biosynthesis glycosyltransferase
VTSRIGRPRAGERMLKEAYGGRFNLTWQGPNVPTPRTHRCKTALRRSFDVVAALSVLILLSPVLVILGLCARLSTGGSALFRQQRLGLGGIPFQMVKFRTLVPDAPCDVNKLQAEHRATRLGRTMRQLKLDELPQFWNILKGDMSLVGPRPIIPEEYRYGSHYDRLTVRPGLTGLWQVSPARGERFDKHPEYDIFYLANSRLTFDLWLIWRTILLIALGREIGLAAVIGRWERNPEWRTAVDNRIGDEGIAWSLRLEPVGTALVQRSQALGAPLLAGPLEAIPASAPPE